MGLWQALKLWRALQRIGGDQNMLESFKSRKFLSAILTGMLNVVNGAAGFPIPESSIEWLNYLIITYIGAEGGADIVSRFKSPTGG